MLKEQLRLVTLLSFLLIGSIPLTAEIAYSDDSSSLGPEATDTQLVGESNGIQNIRLINSCPGADCTSTDGVSSKCCCNVGERCFSEKELCFCQDASGGDSSAGRFFR